jgi:hypothetical protein
MYFLPFSLQTCEVLLYLSPYETSDPTFNDISYCSHPTTSHDGHVDTVDHRKVRSTHTVDFRCEYDGNRQYL